MQSLSEPTPFIISEFLGDIAHRAGGVWRVDMATDAMIASFGRRVYLFPGGSSGSIDQDEYIMVVQPYSDALLSTYIFLVSRADEDARPALMLYVGYMVLTVEAMHDVLLPLATRSAVAQEVLASFAAGQPLLAVFAMREPAQKYLLPFTDADRSLLSGLLTAPDSPHGVRRKGDNHMRALAYCGFLLQLYTHLRAVRRVAPDYVNGRLDLAGLYLSGGSSGGVDHYTVYVLKSATVAPRLLCVVMPLWATDYFQLKVVDLSLAGGTAQPEGRVFGTRDAALASEVSDMYELACAASFSFLEPEARHVADAAVLLGELLVTLVDPYFFRELAEPAYLAVQQRFYATSLDAVLQKRDTDPTITQADRHATEGERFQATRAVVEYMRTKRAQSSASAEFRHRLSMQQFVRVERYYDPVPATVARAYAACAAATDRHQNQHSDYDYDLAISRLMRDVAESAPAFTFTTPVPASANRDVIKATLDAHALRIVEDTVVHRQALFKTVQRPQLPLRYVFLYD